MVTAEFCKFTIGLFFVCLFGCALCYVREWIEAQAEYAREQAQKQYKHEAAKRAAAERREIEALMVQFTEGSV